MKDWQWLLVAIALLWYLGQQQRQAQSRVSNDESWRLERDPGTGRLTGISVHRDVRSHNGAGE